MSTFSQMRLKPDLLQRSCLPDIDYPMPVEALDEVLTSGGQISYAELLYWLQEFSAEQKEGWQNLEAAMLRLAELIAPQDERERLIAEGDTWFLEIGPVDLTSTVIAIQRGDDLVATIAAREDGTLRVATYRPLDGKSIRSLVGLSRRPDPEHGVCMRDNNWEYALDQAGLSTAALYSYVAGLSYLSFWEFGVGVTAEGDHDDRFFVQRQQKALPPNLVATQIGVYYQLCTDDLL